MRHEKLIGNNGGRTLKGNKLTIVNQLVITVKFEFNPFLIFQWEKKSKRINEGSNKHLNLYHK